MMPVFIKCFLLVVVLVTIVESQSKVKFADGDGHGKLTRETRDTNGKYGSGGESILKEPKYKAAPPKKKTLGARLMGKKEATLDQKLDNTFNKQVADLNMRYRRRFPISNDVHKPMTAQDKKKKLKGYRAVQGEQDWYAAYDRDFNYDDEDAVDDELDALLNEMFMAGYEKGLQHGNRRYF
mmetsp:Transcript_27995/g.46119  ORF Transcript_27995/g.46119 Transcript_27995/m.46119 type:complete len:181 (-) Transcript_27995:268-810(-)